MQKPRRLRAMVFDFDGTLARPALDFSLMKARIASLARDRLGRSPEPGPLPALEWIEELAALMPRQSAEAFREESHRMILGMESEAASRTSLFGFVRPVLARLRQRGAVPAVITRNTRLSVDTVFPDAAAYLGVVLAREDVAAVKPDPGHLLAALAALGAGPEEAVMVGDHPTDVLTARRAGTLAAAVASGGTDEEELRLAGPDFLAKDAGELMARLEAEGWL